MAATTQFESEFAVANAEVMLDVCRQEYASAGRHDDVQALWGLDVKSAASAQLALLTVKNLPADEPVVDVRRYTLNALQAAYAALMFQPQSLAS